MKLLIGETYALARVKPDRVQIDSLTDTIMISRTPQCGGEWRVTYSGKSWRVTVEEIKRPEGMTLDV